MQRALESALVGSRRTGARKKFVRCNPQLNKMQWGFCVADKNDLRAAAEMRLPLAIRKLTQPRVMSF
jgi:hypothetical protein